MKILPFQMFSLCPSVNGEGRQNRTWVLRHSLNRNKVSKSQSGPLKLFLCSLLQCREGEAAWASLQTGGPPSSAWVCAYGGPVWTTLGTMLHCSLAVLGQRRTCLLPASFSSGLHPVSICRILIEVNFGQAKRQDNSACGKRQQWPSFAVTSALEKAQSPP